MNVVQALAETSLVSSQAGRVLDHIVTTREVMANVLIESALGQKKSLQRLSVEKPDTREFIRETSAVLLEWAIYNESESSQTAALASADLAEAKSKVQRALRQNVKWQALKVEPRELDAMLERKLRAQKFVQFKIEASAVPISDREAKEYFEANKLKFEDKPFETFKGTIKTFLERQQVDRRLKDWFELLQVKYKVRNFLAEK